MPKSLLKNLKNLPLTREVVWTTKYLLGAKVVPFNGRWTRLRNYLSQLAPLSPAVANLPPRKVLVFATGDFWTNYMLPVAVAVAGRNCQIDFLYYPLEYQPRDRLPERFQVWSAKFRPPQHDRFRVLNLLDWQPQKPSADQIKLAADIARIDACYITCKETIDPENDESDRSAFEFRCRRGEEFLGRLQSLLSERHYDSALTPNGMVFEFGLFHKYCRSQGLMCASLDGFEVDDAVVASQTHACVDWVTDDVWTADEPHRLTPERAARVEHRIAIRDNPALQTDRFHQLQTVPPNPAEELRKALRLDEKKPLALLCTNVAWDSAVIGRGRPFPTMQDWYLELIRWFANRPDWQLVVRTHPVEAKLDQPMSVAQQIDQAIPVLPDNVRLVRPLDKISTYGLMKITDLGLVFASTVGLEMAIRGVPAITAARVHYADRGFTWDPHTREEFFAQLEKALGSERLKVSERQIELARCYFDAYFENFPRKMPWRWSNLHGDLQKWPLSRITAGDCPKEFLRTFDYLAGRPARAAS